MIEKLIVLEDIDPVIFYGVNNANIQLIKALYPKLRIVARGNVIKVLGDEEEMCAFEENITKLEKYCAEYNSLKEEVIIDIVKGNAPQAEKSGNVIVFSVTGKPIIPRSENQLKLVEAFSRNDMVFAIGPAGSGKTYTAIALAVRALKNKEIKKIILSRPAVEAGEKLGFLPGDMKDKIDPYLQPLYDALQDMVPAAKLKEQEAAKKLFVENGGTIEEFVPQADTLEEEFKNTMSVIKEKRNALNAEQEKQKELNLQIKLSIIEELKELVESPEDANKNYTEFKKLQQQWNEVKIVPQARINELWKNYQLYVEKFYDLLKLNNEFREYDFKKNLEIKNHLCEAAEKLADEADVVSAFHQLQKLHQEFRDTGPVAKELRDEIWARFKAASTTVNRRHQQHFEALKEACLLYTSPSPRD